MKIVYVSCGVNNHYMKVDHWSYRRHFCSWEKKAWKKYMILRDSNPWPLRYRCSALTNWGNKPTGSRSFSLFVINPWKNVAPVSQRSRVRIPYKPEFFFGLSFRNCKSCVCNCDGLFSYNNYGHIVPVPKMFVLRELTVTLEGLSTLYICSISKIQLAVYYQCCVLISWATTRLYVIAH